MPPSRKPTKFDDDTSRSRNIADANWKAQLERYKAKKSPEKPQSWAEKHGIDNLNKPKTSADIKNQEAAASDQAGTEFGGDLGAREDRGSANYRNHFTGDSSQPTGLRGNLTKKRNLAFILGTSFLGVGLFFTVLLTPAFALINLKETLVDKFDDRMQTLEHKRSIRLLNKKLRGNPLTAGCKVVKVKCRFKGMSRREADKFQRRNPDSKVNTGRCLLGRCKVLSIEFVDSDGVRKTVQPSEFKAYLKNNREFRAHVFRYNKSFVAHFRDKSFGKVATKLKLFFGKHTSDKPPPGEGTPEERARAKAEEDAKAKEAERLRLEEENKLKSKLKKSVGAIVLVCLAKDLIEAANKAALVELIANLIPLAVSFVNAADDVKNGTATGDQGTTNNISQLGEQLIQKDDNGETAFDSFGYQYAAFGVIDKKNQKNAQQYQVGGGANQNVIIQALQEAGSDKVISVIDAIGIDKLCKFLGSAVVIGAVCTLTAIASGGTAAIVCAAQAALGVILAPILIKKLLPLLVSTVKTTGLVGGKAANAAIGGFIALENINNKDRGAYPLKKDQAIQFDKFSDNAQGGGKWVGKDSAYVPDNPFDRFSQKLAQTFLPSLSKLSSVSAIPTTLASFSSGSLASLGDSAQARTVIKGEYDQCDDPQDGSQDLATDPFCVPQFGFDPSIMLGDNNFNSASTADVPASHNPTNSVAAVFQNLFGGQTAEAKEFDDTRGFTPDNRFDADNVISYMLDDDPAFHGDRIAHQPWIDDNGDPINYDPPTCLPGREGVRPYGPYSWCMTDYADYTAACLEVADLTTNSGMCAPKNCKEAATDSREFRYCMYAMYAHDTTMDDQYQDNDAALSGGSGGGASSDPTEVDGGGEVSNDSKGLAQQLLDNPNVTYPYTDTKGVNVRDVLEEVAKTGKGIVNSPDVNFTRVAVSSKLLQALVDYAKDHKLGLNALTNADHSSTSNHYKGIAIDIACNPPLDRAAFETIADKYGGKNNGEVCPAAAHWHYDFPASGG